MGNGNNRRLVDKREDHDKAVASCEGVACNVPKRCMLVACLAPTQCFKNLNYCVARLTFTQSAMNIETTEYRRNVSDRSK